MGEGIIREFGINMYTLLYLKWITHCLTQGTQVSVMGQPGWEGSWGENGYMCIRLSPFAAHLKHNVVNQLDSNIK